MHVVLAETQLPLRLRPAVAMSDDELLAFCAANEPLRVERDGNGEILLMTPAGSKTSMMNARIGRFLQEWAEADGRGVVFESNGGFTLKDGSMRAADAAWVEASRWNALSESEQAGFAPLCPEFVIELRSRRDGLPALEGKMRQWMANGAAVAWLIDPESRTVTIYRAGEPAEVLHDPTSVQGDGPVRGFALAMGRVWG